MNNKNILQLKNINKSFRQGKEKLEVLNNISLDIKAGTITGLIGQSGCGKSTLLKIAGILNQADSGEVIINGKHVEKLPESRRTKKRLSDIGFVYQFHHLLPEFSALENVMLPQIIAKVPPISAKRKATLLLERLGLKDRLNHRPGGLSGGEQQRTAIARAIANSPKILLADEPTGNLDPQTAESVFELLIEMVKQVELTALIVTHNENLAKKMNKVYRFNEGKLEEE